jgi:DNA-binding winged helix-turn-helix (wHTH) protein
MISSGTSMLLLRIGDVILDPADGTLRAAGGVVRLEPKVQAVLQLLVDRAGSVVSQDTLLNEVWPNTYVAPGALATSSAIEAIRSHGLFCASATISTRARSSVG